MKAPGAGGTTVEEYQGSLSAPNEIVLLKVLDEELIGQLERKPGIAYFGAY